MIRIRGFDAPSLIRTGALSRLIAALAVSAAVWGAILWAMA